MGCHGWWSGGALEEATKGRYLRGSKGSTSLGQTPGSKLGRLSRASLYFPAFTTLRERYDSLMIIGNFLYSMHTTDSASITFGIVF